ncbi:multiple PDZ domain-containing protein [Loa loa]|uniref:Multiple PDZ domain-containing protein n=1 Tax=Loa loa TaxID=7209 RepID=A0A1S0UGV2_LOALO|nr:multiple PDZ domain-containing protein [Loa loa]EJD74656.1 multiple PDZ domain-containing protein [Loa loa]
MGFNRRLSTVIISKTKALLKEIWLELFTSEHLPKATSLDSSEKECRPSLSELIETTPSTSVAPEEIPRQSASSMERLDSSENLHKKSQKLISNRISNTSLNETESGKEKNYSLASGKEEDSGMDGRRKGRQKESAVPVSSEQLNMASGTDQLIIQSEMKQNSLTEAELNPSMPAIFSDDSLPSSLSSETCLPASSNRFKFWGQTRTVILNREPNQSFGISIVGGRVEVSHKSGQPGMRSTVSGIFIKSVLPNSLAGLSNMMNMGDRVISVNDQDLREATHEHAVQVIKNAKNPVKFVVQSLHSLPLDQTDINEEEDEQREEDEKSMNKRWKATEECDNLGATSTSNLVEIAIKESYCGHIRELTAIEETSRRESLTSVGLKTESQKRDEFQFDNVGGHEMAEPIKKTSIIMNKEKLEGMDTLENLSQKRNDIKRESENVSGARRREIDPDSAAALPKRDEDLEEEDQFFYTKDKINRKYGNLLGDTILLKLDKVPRNGLGLSLSSNHDRDQMSILVVAVKSNCPLSVKIGDELLEVNGKVLIGLSHLNASSIMRECCEDGILELLLLRRFEALAITLDSRKFNGSNTIGNEAQMSSNSGETNAQHSTEDVKKKSSRQNESVVGIETGRETLIEIDKDGKGLGLSIVGGSDTVLGTVVIHEVYPDGAAAVDGRLKPGDQVLEVNGVSLRGVSHEQAILLLRRTPTKVSLLIYRDVNLQLSLLDPTQIYNIFEIELTKKPGRGLGLSIVGRKNEPGVYVSEVVKGGAAEADGRLIQGDQILAVNGQDVASAMQEDVAAKLKACTGRVTLKVGRWKLTEAANKVHAAADAALSNSERHSDDATQQSKLITTSKIKLCAPNNESSSVSITPNDRKTTSLSTSVSVSKSQISTSEENQSSQITYADLSPVTEESSSGADQKSSAADEESSSITSLGQNKDIELIKDLNEENSDSLLIVLKKIPDQQLGMGIGKRTRGILVTSLQPGSIAAEKLKVGDRLMAVNGVAITDQLSAVALVKASGKKLWLQISRPRTYQNP